MRMVRPQRGDNREEHDFTGHEDGKIRAASNTWSLTEDPGHGSGPHGKESVPFLSF